MTANSRAAVSWGKMVSEPKATGAPAAKAAPMRRSRSPMRARAFSMLSCGKPMASPSSRM